MADSEKNIFRLCDGKKERGLLISENRNVSSRLCRKPAFDGNGKTFSFAYAIIRGWLSAYMPTTELWCWKENFGADGTDKAYLFALPYKNKYLRLLTVCLHTISKRRYLSRLCHKSDGCLSGFIQVILIGLPTMALPKMRAERIFFFGILFAVIHDSLSFYGLYHQNT